MPSSAITLLRKGLNLIPSLVVLAILVGLLAWGRFYKWKLPPFAQLWGDPAASQSGEAPTDLMETDVIPIASSDAASANAEQPRLYRVRCPSVETVRKVGIQVAPVEERPMAQYVEANGILDYDQTLYAELSPRASGTVWTVLKKEGDAVRRGEVLALVASPEVARAKNEFTQSLLVADVKRRILERMEANSNSTPAAQIYAARDSLREAQIHLSNARQTLINFGLPVRLEDVRGHSEEEVFQHLHTLSVPRSVLRETGADLLPTNLLPLIAPFDGEVVKRDMVIGEVVSSSQVQLIIADTRRLWILLDVRLEDAGLLKIGQEVTFRPDGTIQKEARGAIAWISPGVDKRTRRVRVRVEVENPDRQLRPDTFGTGSILVVSTENSIAVPTKAIQREDKNYFVFVQVGDTVFEQRRITLGIHGREFTEARSGVRPGESVVTTGSHLLKSAIVHTRLLGED